MLIFSFCYIFAVFVLSHGSTEGTRADESQLGGPRLGSAIWVTAAGKRPAPAGCNDDGAVSNAWESQGNRGQYNYPI